MSWGVLLCRHVPRLNDHALIGNTDSETMIQLFCAGNVENAEMSPTGYPFIEIFYQATNSTRGVSHVFGVFCPVEIAFWVATHIAGASPSCYWSYDSSCILRETC